MEHLDEEYKVTLSELDLSSDVKEVIGVHALACDCLPERALELIVEEWAKFKFATSSSQDGEDSLLGNLASKIEKVDKLTDEVILKLKRASL